jgi:hypothetical protein
MVRVLDEKIRATTQDVDKEYHGRWVLFDLEGFGLSSSDGYIVAIGDGSKESWENLLDINFKRFSGRAMLVKGNKNRGEMISVVEVR